MLWNVESVDLLDQKHLTSHMDGRGCSRDTSSAGYHVDVDVDVDGSDQCIDDDQTLESPKLRVFACLAKVVI